MTRKAYFIGVGSNVQPEQNVPAILTRLLDDFAGLRVSRLCFTEPVGIDSNNIFVNFVVYVESVQDASAIKQYCNKVEHDFGRDRSHPDRKRLDRKADLDIVYTCGIDELHTQAIDVQTVCDETFLQPMFQELLDFIFQVAIKPAVYPCLECEVAGLTLGQMPAAINLDCGARDKVVVQ